MRIASCPIWRLTWCAVVSAAAGCAGPVAAPPAGRPGIDILLKPETVPIQGLVPPHATLDALLRTYDLTGDAVNRLVGTVRPVFDPRRLRAAQPFELVRTLDGGIRRFAYEIDTAPPACWSRWISPPAS